MPPHAAYLTLPASTLDRLLAEAASSGIDPIWMLAAFAAELPDLFSASPPAIQARS